MRRELPSGTVTFLFTDVEGSTRLLQKLGAAGYASALAEHRRVLRDAFVRHSGVEVDTQGDAFFVAFPTAPGALQAAAEAQAALAPGPMRVRMGLHTGTPLVTEEGYVGTDVHRVARIAGAGSGGQVLVSASTRALVDDDALRDLGEHRLKDLAAPERLFQLGADEFPPLRSLYRTNLPVPATPFLGRAAELGQVVTLLNRDDVRLLTLTGPGGTGKTRLAAQAAAEASERFLDGITFVPLAPLRDPALLLPTVAQSLGLMDESGREPLGALTAALADKQALLLLDNAEHLLPRLVLELEQLRTIPGPTLLVTSRERLRLQGEQVLAVPSLSDPDAAELFLARARALDPDFASNRAVGELCTRLDNLPLALELAAARTPLFSVEQLLDRIGQRLDLFRGERDADPRQRTLRATIEWSHDLLRPDEQMLFRRFSVFAGGCTYEVAEDVAGADPDRLQSLIDKSLLRRRIEKGREPRFWMLETIREFAGERLDEAPVEAEELRMRHAEFFLELAAQGHEENGEHDQAAWLRRVHDERDNFRAALGWSRDAGEYELELKIARHLSVFWYLRGHASEGLRWLEDALANDSRRDPRDSVAALNAACALAYQTGAVEQATRHGRESLELFEALGDRKGMSSALNNLGLIALEQGEYEEAREMIERSLEIDRERGDDRGVAICLANLGYLALTREDLDDAAGFYEQSLALCRDADYRPGMVQALGHLAAAHLKRGRSRDAIPLLGEALELAREVEYTESLCVVLDVAAGVAAAAQQPRYAARIAGAASGLRKAHDLTLPPFEGSMHAETAATVRHAVGDQAFADLFHEGSGLSVEQAIDEALASLQAVNQVRA